MKSKEDDYLAWFYFDDEEDIRGCSRYPGYRFKYEDTDVRPGVKYPIYSLIKKAR